MREVKGRISHPIKKQKMQRKIISLVALFFSFLATSQSQTEECAQYSQQQLNQSTSAQSEELLPNFDSCPNSSFNFYLNTIGTEQCPDSRSSDQIISSLDDYSIFSEEQSLDPGAEYDRLAQNYEQDIPSVGYYNHIMCHSMVETLNIEQCKRSNLRVLDLACGTGWVAELLVQSGFTNIDCIDASSEMVKIAESKGFYSDLHVGYLGTGTMPQKFVGIYDIVTMAGALNKNHAPPQALDDVFLSLKQNGIAIFTIPDKYAEELGYLPLLRKKENQSICEFIESQSYTNYDKSESGGKNFLEQASFKVYVYRKL